MALQLSKRRPFKVYVKKLDNGFGLKTVNTLTGVENILIITTDSIKSSLRDRKKIESQNKVLRPLWTKFSSEVLSATLSMPSLIKPYAINKVFAQLDPKLLQANPSIAGFHIFEDANTIPASNVQKTSVIFVANTELAREKGVHFKIPGKLINIFFADGQKKEGKFQFEADSVVKPFIIIVSEYIIYVDICYDFPSKNQIKSVGTQTKRRYLLSSSVQNNKPLYKIESCHHNCSEAAKQKSSQTTTTAEETQFSQSDSLTDKDGQQPASYLVGKNYSQRVKKYDEVVVIELDQTKDIETHKNSSTSESNLKNKSCPKRNGIEVQRTQIEQDQAKLKILHKSSTSTFSSGSERNKLDSRTPNLEHDLENRKAKLISATSLSGMNDKCHSDGGIIGLSPVSTLLLHNITDTDSFDHTKDNSDQLQTEITPSQNSLNSYNSHTYSNKTQSISHLRNQQGISKAILEQNKENEQNEVEVDKDHHTLTLFDNSSNYISKITNSNDNVLLSTKEKYSNVTADDTLCRSRTSVDSSETSVKTIDKTNRLSEHRLLFESNSNVSIKEIKSRLNKTTKSLQELYSVVELLEDRMDSYEYENYNEENDHTEGLKSEPLDRKFVLRKINNLSSEESSNINNIDNILSQKKSIENISSGFEKSMGDSAFLSSDILCEWCGSFHSAVGHESNCKQFEQAYKESEEGTSCKDFISLKSSTNENYSKIYESTSTVQSNDSEKSMRHRSSDYLTRKSSSHLETNDDISITSYDHVSRYSEETSVNKQKFKKSIKTPEGVLKEDRESNKDVSTARKADDFSSKQTMADKKVLEDFSRTNQTIVSEGCNSKCNVHSNQIKFQFNNEHKTQECSITRKELNKMKSSSCRKGVQSFYRTVTVDNFQKNTSKVSNQSICSNRTYILGGSDESLTKSICFQDSSDFEGKVILNKSPSISVTNNDNFPSFAVLSNKESCLVNVTIADQENSSDQILANKATVKNQTKNSKSAINDFKTLSFKNIFSNYTRTNFKVFNFSEFHKTKSWISFKKSVKYCNPKFERKLSKSEPNTYQLKMENLSSGDHQHENLQQEAVTGSKERLDAVNVSKIRSTFHNCKYSSSSTLHIFPSSEDILQQKSQKSSFVEKEWTTSKLEMNNNSSRIDNLNMEQLPKLNKSKNKQLIIPSRNKNCINFHTQSTAEAYGRKSTDYEGTTNLTTHLNNNKPKKQTLRKKKKWFCFKV